MDLEPLLSTLPAWRSPAGRLILETLARHRGHIGRAAFFARRVGLRSRHQLHRLLRREGLPPIEVLGAWIRILRWVIEAETEHLSLCAIATRSGLDPSACNRTVRCATGFPWKTVQRRGPAWVVLRIIDECGNGGQMNRYNVLTS